MNGLVLSFYWFEFRMVDLGRDSYQGRSLHSIGPTMNIYEQALYAIAKTLSPFDADNLIPCYGFGDNTTRANGIFPFYKNDTPAQGLESTLRNFSIVKFWSRCVEKIS